MPVRRETAAWNSVSDPPKSQELLRETSPRQRPQAGSATAGHDDRLYEDLSH